MNEFSYDRFPSFNGKTPILEQDFYQNQSDTLSDYEIRTPP